MNAQNDQYNDDIISSADNSLSDEDIMVGVENPSNDGSLDEAIIDNIFYISTDHVTALKNIVEIIKEIKPEINMEIITDPRYPNKEVLVPQKNIEVSESDDEAEVNGQDEATHFYQSSDSEVSEEPEAYISSDSSEVEVKAENNEDDISGIRIMTLDSSQTVLIYVKLYRSEFLKFDCKVNKMTIGVNLSQLYSLIKSIDKEDTISLSINRKEKNLLSIKVDTPEKEITSHLKLLDLKEVPLGTPENVYPKTVSMPSADFHKICRDMNSIADEVEIVCTKNQITFSCKGDFANKEITLNTAGGKTGVNIDNKSKDEDAEIVRGIYPLKDLILFNKCPQICQELIIHMRSDWPLMILYPIVLGKMIIIISPKTGDESNINNYDEELQYYSSDDSDTDLIF